MRGRHGSRRQTGGKNAAFSPWHLTAGMRMPTSAKAFEQDPIMATADEDASRLRPPRRSMQMAQNSPLSAAPEDRRRGRHGVPRSRSGGRPCCGTAGITRCCSPTSKSAMADSHRDCAAQQQQNVPYTFSEGARDPGAATGCMRRLRLAAEGLPRGGLAGFELMENQKLGLSQFNEQVNFQRALEGDSPAPCRPSPGIERRVHLAIPNRPPSCATNSALPRCS